MALGINDKINLFIQSIERIKLPDSRGARLFCLTINDDQQAFYVEIDNINISKLLIKSLEDDNMLSGIEEIEKNSPEFIEQQYRILEKYFIDKIRKRVVSSLADIVVLSRVEFTYPYITNAFRIMMEFENEYDKAILLILPGEKKAENLYRYLNKIDISSPSFRIKDIMDFRRN